MNTELTVRQEQPMRVMGIAVSNLDQVIQVCGMLAKSGAAPTHFNSPEKVLAGIMYGRELGLGPWQALQSLYPVRGKYALMGQDMLGMIQASGKLEWMKAEDYETSHEGKPDKGVRVTMKRSGQEHPFVGEFTWRQAQAAGLAGKDTYKAYGRDMLYWRAFARAARGFADVTKGLVVYEDYRDVPTPQRGVTGGEAVMADTDPLLIESESVGTSITPAPSTSDDDRGFVPSEDELARIREEEAQLKF